MTLGPGFYAETRLVGLGAVAGCLLRVFPGKYRDISVDVHWRVTSAVAIKQTHAAHHNAAVLPRPTGRPFDNANRTSSREQTNSARTAANRIANLRMAIVPAAGE